MRKKDFLDPVAFILSKMKLRKHLKKDKIPEIIQATSEYIGYGYYNRISMSQKRNEIVKAAESIKAHNPEVVVEIGTRKGGTLFTWARATKANLIVSIDLEGGIHGGGYPPQKKKFYKQFVNDNSSRHIELIQGDSHSDETKAQLLKILKGRSIDFLFIDGDHTYKGIKQDFEMYSPLVRKGGIIGFHDIVPNLTNHEDSATIEVPKFWEEVKKSYKFKEIIDPEGHSWMGIGFLYV